MSLKKIAVAIDGPAGAGKSSISKVVAKQLGYLYIDTGAMYRSVTWAVLHDGIDPTDQAAVETILPTLELTMEPGNDACKVFVRGPRGDRPYSYASSKQCRFRSSFP